MKERRRANMFVGGLLASLFIAAVGLSAHHAAQTEFDVSKDILAVGVLTKVELINPHSYVHFDIKGADGKVTAWSFETVSPAALKQAGIAVRDAFKVGQTYKFTYSPARKGGPLGILWTMVLPDGKFLALGSANNVEAGRKLTSSPAPAQ